MIDAADQRPAFQTAVFEQSDDLDTERQDRVGKGAAGGLVARLLGPKFAISDEAFEADAEPGCAGRLAVLVDDFVHPLDERLALGRTAASAGAVAVVALGESALAK